MAKYHDITAIIGEREGARAAIEGALAASPHLRAAIHPIYVPRPDPIRFPLIRHVFHPLYYYTYNRWHRRAYSAAVRALQSKRHHLVHQLNMIGFREPGYLYRCGLPFVWGPIGGMLNLPVGIFWRDLGVKYAAFHTAKNALNFVQLRWKRRVGFALRRADALVVASSDEAAVLQRVHGLTAKIIPPTGCVAGTPRDDHQQFAFRRDELNIVWSGLHIPRKGLSILLRSLALVPVDIRWRLHVLGEGPCTSAWRALGSRLGIAERCEWHGWLPKIDAQAVMAACDVLAFPSLVDAAPAVVAESLAMGVPVICLAGRGVGEMIDTRCGITLEVNSAAEAHSALAEAVTMLATDRPVLARLKAGAIERARELTWDRNARAMCSVYEQAIDAFRQKSRHSIGSASA